MPALMRRDVRLLGDVLGEVLSEASGQNLLNDVERLRRLTIDVRVGRADDDQIAALVASWPLPCAELVARAFTVYFHLVNLAEAVQRIRTLRARDADRAPIRESFALAVDEISRTEGPDRMREFLRSLEIHPVFTAHPPEARRRAVVTALRRIADALFALDDDRLGSHGRAELRRRLREEVDLLWRTSPLRVKAMGPLDEVCTVMAAFDETIFRVVPAFYRDIDRTLAGHQCGSAPPGVPAFLRVGSWVGGDRDGNPFVTAQVTRETVLIQADHVLRALQNATTRIGRALTAQTSTTPACDALLRALAVAEAAHPDLLGEITARAPQEPHRQYLLWQAETFGFHLAELEIRQHSEAHARALAEVRAGGARSAQTEEVLATLRVIRWIQDRFGVEACRRYVVSFTRSAADIAAVYELAAAAMPDGRRLVLDVVPLLESGDDLRGATEVLDGMLALPEVADRLAATGRRMEVMLGYSDSAKELGPVSATLLLYET